MKVKSKPKIVINSEYIITSRELKKIIEIKGEIKNINLWKGRSPNDMEAGKSSDDDEWIIYATEVKKMKK